MEKEKQIIEEMALDVWQTGGIDLEIAGAIAIDLYEQGYRKVDNGCTIKKQGESELQKVFNELLEGNTYVKQRQGEWVINKSEVEVDIYCSKCNYQYTEADPCNYELYNYCPNCGAKMKGVE